MKICKECGGLLVITSEGRLACSNCGLIYNNMFFEQQRETNEEIPVIPTIPLGSKINSGSYGIFKDNLNRKVDERLQIMFKTIKRLDDRLKTYQASANIGSILLNNFLQITSELNLSKNLAYDALRLYLKVYNYCRQNNYNFSCPTISAACLLVTSRIYGENKVVNLEEITNVFLKYGHRVSKNKIAWCVSIINKKILDKPLTYKNLVKIYLDRFCKIALNNYKIHEKTKKIKIDIRIFLDKIKRKATEILENFNDVKIQSKNPFVFAASLFYVAEKRVAKELGIKPLISQRLTSEICQVPEFSLREHLPLFKNAC